MRIPELIEARYELTSSTAKFNADWLALPKDDQSPVKESNAPILISFVPFDWDGLESSSEQLNEMNKEHAKINSATYLANNAEVFLLM